jgi:cytochrome P450
MFCLLTQDPVPGPKLAAATTLYFNYKMARGDEVSWHIECHKKYGEVVRVNPNRLSYINPRGWKDVYGHRTGGRLEFYKEANFSMPTENGEHSITTEPTAEHGQVRRVFTNAFSDKALKLQEPLIRLHVDKLIRNINKAIAADPEVHLDVVKLLNHTTFDIMGDLTFGEPLGMLDTGKYTPWVKTVFDSIKLDTYFRVGRLYLPFRLLMKMFMSSTMKKKAKEYFQHSADRVDKRLSKGTDIGKSDIRKLVLENQKTKLPVPKMHANASVFMIAGTETTATLLSGFTYLLLRNPEKMKKLVAEVRALREEELTLETLPRLEYLSACLEESLRCYPPVPVALPRVVPKGGAMVAGEWLPEKVKANYM